jgi:hypothetical protein
VRRILAALACVALAATLPLGPVQAHPPSGPGGVFVTGHDPDFHAHFGGNTTGARNLLHAAIEYVTFGEASPSVLLVTSRIEPPAGHVDSKLGLIAAGYTFDMASAAGVPGADGIDPLELGTVNFSSYDVIVVASDYGGILTQAELDLLNARSGDLIDFVNNGGGLVALAESNSGARLTRSGGHFDFLPFLATEQIVNQNEVGFSVTPFGESLGLTDADVNGNASHTVFMNTGGMEVVNVDASQRIMSLAVRGVEICSGGVPSASVGDVAATEGNAGDVTSFTFTVSLDVNPCGDAVTVDYATSDGSAAAGDDYSATTGTLTFAPGTTSQTVTVPVVGDDAFEPDETFLLNLSNASNATILDGEGMGTVVNDDPENRAPDCSSVTARPGTLWPPRHDLREVSVGGATDPDGDTVRLSITGVTQDEPLDGPGDGATSPDAATGRASNTVLVRAERAAGGDGRVYAVSFSGTDVYGATCSGTVRVAVPHARDGRAAVDSGQTVNSFGP